MKATFVCSLVVSLLFAPSLAAKGTTTKITIRDTMSGRSVDITRGDCVQGFNVWAGAGTSTNRVEGTEGFIIDWASGIVDRPGGLRRYEVQFYTTRSGDGQPTYVVFYDLDPSSQRGFVYLPGSSDDQYRRNVTAIFRGREGNWFRASAQWENVVRTLIPVP